VFFKEILLPLVEGVGSGSFEHRWLAVGALTRICGDAQCIVDLYVNYDCDLSAANIFERLVNHLSRIAQGGGHHHHGQGGEGGASAGGERALRVKGIEGLVAILQCMVEWSQSLYVTSGSQSNLEGGEVKGGQEEEPPVLTLAAEGGGGEYNPEQFEAMKQQKDIWEQGIYL
jgi:brefeldin A-inhibited guanine nucleotide-exchange protein